MVLSCAPWFWRKIVFSSFLIPSFVSSCWDKGVHLKVIESSVYETYYCPSCSGLQSPVPYNVNMSPARLRPLCSLCSFLTLEQLSRFIFHTTPRANLLFLRALLVPRWRSKSLSNFIPCPIAPSRALWRATESTQTVNRQLPQHGGISEVVRKI